jgi:hypothetical protein
VGRANQIVRVEYGVGSQWHQHRRHDHERVEKEQRAPRMLDGPIPIPGINPHDIR